MCHCCRARLHLVRQESSQRHNVTSVYVLSCVSVYVHPSGFVQTITSIFNYGFQNNLAPLFFLMNTSAI